MLLTSERTLRDLTKTMRHHNVFPMFLGRYLREESKHPVCSLLREAVADAVEVLLAADDAELAELYDGLDHFSKNHIAPDLIAARDRSAIREMALSLIALAIEAEYNDLRPLLQPSYLADSEVLRVYPELEQFHTKDGTLRLDTPGLQLTSDAVFYRDHVLYIHQFLRRSFGANPNYDFMRTLADYHEHHPDQVVSLAIDHTRILSQEWYAAVMEKDYWYGPKFSWSEIDNPAAVGLTVYKPTDDIGRAMLALNGLERTEFLWSYRNGLKTLQIEELHLLNSRSKAGQPVVNRYAHSIRDIAQQRFTHLDGSAMVYEPQLYATRFSATMPSENRRATKVKLFRVDASEKDRSIPEDEWSALVSFFFRQNDMVLEYLQGAPPKS